ncbi:DUF7310 family coiled-coil domain-containing protein [Haloarcula onubensis]|uniref:DUF7310 domain-containing protein n=1 Tax=Haloarcula onubensis TaxID=2950539 RepID=A0ABU2FK99_9EURY|nr:hypothetical protein [Halomicroarcula sp. S3CR25-11]MDS0281153.1 hypothetical protein [Halomicroarcula sp. S3CR25-11]
MTDVETLAERVDTVERAVTDGDHDFPAVDDLAELTERIEALEAEVTELHDRADELEAATQALRGYVGNVRSVNERVEGRADAALAATERLERRLDAATEDRRPVDDGSNEDQRPVGVDDTEVGPGVDPSPRETESGEPTHENHGLGGPTAGLAGVDTEDAARANGDSSEQSASEPSESGVLEQIRSLL